MSAKITVLFIVPAGYLRGDYCLLCGNDGLGGDVDFDSLLSDERHELFPKGAGIYGFGHAPFGNFRFGHGHSSEVCNGFGHLPFGHFPFGHGTGVVQVDHEVESCGRYKFGLKCYDELGNAHSGTPEEVPLELHIAPESVVGLKKNSYNKDTDILVLDVES